MSELENPKQKQTNADEINFVLKDWHPSEDDLKIIQPLAKETLDRVTSLTEYEDAKAGRLLTVATILSAGSLAIYSSFRDVIGNR